MKKRNVFFLAQDDNLAEVLGGYDAAHLSKGGAVSRPTRNKALFQDGGNGWYGPNVWAVFPNGMAVFMPSAGITRKEAFRMLATEGLKIAERRVIPLPA